MLGVYYEQGKMNSKIFGQYYNRRRNNKGITIVVFERGKCADLQFDWDDGYDSPECEDLLRNFQNNENEIYLELKRLFKFYDITCKLHCDSSQGKFQNLSIDVAKSLAGDISMLYQQKLGMVKESVANIFSQSDENITTEF